jgi:hypothetical protein
MRTSYLARFAVSASCLLFLFAQAPAADAYSVQTHEELIDLAWKQSIAPLLRARFPGITAAQLQEAHSYAYGGSVIQDIGYYPFGNEFFSDLTHYVRAGDFVDALLHDAKTPDELAFAVGALAHYFGDCIGHSEATNPSVAAQFPKLAQKYGRSVSYEENPHDHVRTEFAFDIDQISKRRMAPRRYLDHVGLNVSTSLLARAFYETYGLELNKTLTVERTTVLGYRFSVRRFLPRIAYAETILHRHSFADDTPSPDLTALEADLKQADQDNGWETFRSKAGPGTYLLAGTIYILPKFGVLSELAIKGPDAQAEYLYIKSVNDTIKALRAALLNLRTPPPATGPHPVRQVDFPNRDLDTGQHVRPGSYRLTDETYARLVERLTADPKLEIPSGLKEDVLEYYADPAAPDTLKRKPAKWERLQAELVTLKAMPTVPLK